MSYTIHEESLSEEEIRALLSRPRLWALVESISFAVAAIAFGVAAYFVIMTKIGWLVFWPLALPTIMFAINAITNFWYFIRAPRNRKFRKRVIGFEFEKVWYVNGNDNKENWSPDCICFRTPAGQDYWLRMDSELIPWSNERVEVEWVTVEPLSSWGENPEATRINVPQDWLDPLASSRISNLETTVGYHWLSHRWEMDEIWERLNGGVLADFVEGSTSIPLCSRNDPTV